MTEVRTWRDGVPVPSDARSWGVTLAEHLGCGFRVQVPAARDREAARTFTQAQVRRLAELLGATVDDVPWQALAADTDEDGPVVVEGGWEPVFRGPPGTASTRVSPGPELAPDRAATTTVLPWPVGEGSELDALPLHSTHEAVVARRHLGEGRAGLWVRRDGSVARSTAGNLLVGLGDAWWHTEPGPGRVPTWIAEALATALGARPRRTTEAELADVLDAGGVVVAVDGWGTLTRLHLTEAGTSRGGSDDAVARAVARAWARAWARIVDARDALLVQH